MVEVQTRLLRHRLFLSKLSLTQVSNSDFLEVVERRKRITKSNFGAACICPLHHCPLYRSRLCRCGGRASGTTTYQRSDGKLQQARETGGFQVTSYIVVQPVEIISSLISFSLQVANESDAIVLKFGLTLQQIMDVVSLHLFINNY